MQTLIMKLLLYSLLCSTALAASTTPQKHLVVLVHGLSGTAADLGYLARRLAAPVSVRAHTPPPQRTHRSPDGRGRHLR